MVQQRDIYQLACFQEIVSKTNISPTGHLISRRMVMAQDNGSCILQESLSKYRPAVNSCPVKCTAIWHFSGDYPMMGGKDAEIKNPSMWRKGTCVRRL